MRLVGRTFAMAGITALLSAALAAPAVAGPEVTTRWVDDDGTAGPNGCGGSAVAHTSVQAAIDASDRNDVVIVCPGVYAEEITITGNRRGLTVRGASKWTARLRPPSNPGLALVRIENVRDVTLRWLDLRFPTGGDCVEYEDAVFAEGARGVRIRGNRIRPSGPDTFDGCGYADGLDISSSRGVLVSANTIRDFKSDGIAVDNSSGRIHSNSIRFFHAGYGSDSGGNQGIETEDSSFTISANVVRARGAYGSGIPSLEDGIDTTGGSDTVIRGNRVSGATIGIDVASHGFVVKRNVATRNGDGLHAHGEGIRLRANDARGNQTLDCLDESSGSGTAGTANTWVGNLGDTQSPDGICSLP